MANTPDGDEFDVRYVAFLRAINTGSRRIKMADLRSVYVDAGYNRVETHIATGNVIFDAPSPPHPTYLERLFVQKFGFHSEVFLRTADDVRSIPGRVPWGMSPLVVEISFLEREPAASDAKALEETATEPEALAVAGTEVFFLRGRGRGVPTIHKESTSERLLQMRMTRRGLATVEGIVDKYL